MQKNIQPTPKIIGESFFQKQPKDAILLEQDFVRMDKSIIWKCSDLFWKHYTLWEEINGEDFESALPSGISESHRGTFITNSAEKFLHVLRELDSKHHLPEIIYVYEQGPGTGNFAKGFLDYVKENGEEFYKKITYLLTDASEEILNACKMVLEEHQTQTQYFNQVIFENMNTFNGKFLFARHSNVWDGWPCRHIQVRKSGLGEVYVRAISNRKFAYIIDEIHREGLEKALLNNKEQWKEFFRSIKLQKRTIPVDRIDIQDHIYLQHLSETSSDHIGSNTLLSDLIVQNLSFLNRLIDWERNGYAEIVDIVTSEPRTIYPKKFDGSIGYIVDGHIITTWAEDNNKQVIFTPIRKLNTMVTITKKSNEISHMIHDATYEIFPTDKAMEAVNSFGKNAHLAITCTSKKGLDYTIDTAIALRKKGYNAYPHIIARQIPDEKSLMLIKKKLEREKLREVFVAAGDIGNASGEFHATIDLLHACKKIEIPFKNLAVTGYPEGHSKISDKKLLQALKDKQKFILDNKLNGRIISQLCFDADTIVRWAMSLKEKGIELPIVVGIAGPCNIFQLAEFAVKCGVGESVKFLTSKKSLGKNIFKNIVQQYDPKVLIDAILEHPHFAKTHIVGLHFYTFNNIQAIIDWQKNILEILKEKD